MIIMIIILDSMLFSILRLIPITLITSIFIIELSSLHNFSIDFLLQIQRLFLQLQGKNKQLNLTYKSISLVNIGNKLRTNQLFINIILKINSIRILVDKVLLL